MSSTENPRSSKTDPLSARERKREAAPHSAPNGSQQSSQDSGAPGGGGSLRSRISDTEVARPLGPPMTNSYRAESSRDEERDNKKRTASGMC